MTREEKQHWIRHLFALRDALDAQIDRRQNPNLVNGWRYSVWSGGMLSDFILLAMNPSAKEPMFYTTLGWIRDANEVTPNMRETFYSEGMRTALASLRSLIERGTE